MIKKKEKKWVNIKANGPNEIRYLKVIYIYIPNHGYFFLNFE